MKSPITGALRVIAGAAGASVLGEATLSNWPELGFDTAVFQYPGDFAVLWGRDEGGLSGIAGRSVASAGDRETTLVLVCGEVPPSGEGRSRAQYLTAHDWALAYSIALYRRAETTEALPRVRILLLDLSPRLSADVDPVGHPSFGSSVFRTLHRVFPWIESYRPLPRGSDSPSMEVPALLPPGLDDLQYAWARNVLDPRESEAAHLVEDLLNPDRVLTTFPDEDHAPRRTEIELVCDMWRTFLLRAGGRHDLANMIGPMILAEGLPGGRAGASTLFSGEVSNEVPALLSLLRELELTGTRDPALEAREGATVPGILEERTPPPALPRFLLVDDQFAQGYQHVLGHVLLGDAYGSAKQPKKLGSTLRCLDNAWPLFEKLDELDKVDDWGAPRVLTALGCEVLLLDLRLWLRGEPAKKQAFLGQLVDLCDQLGARGIESAAFQTALAQARQAAIRPEAAEIAPLALFPLLLSHYDPSLPIVLFSSTQQRSLIELFAHRSNIITAFSKPTLSGYGDEIDPGVAISTLRAALERALELHDMRRLWRRIAELEEGDAPTFMSHSKDGTSLYYRPGSDEHRSGFRLRGPALRKTLAAYYEQFLLSGRFAEFWSVPYQLLEASCVPEEQLLDAKWKAEVKFPAAGRERPAKALRLCRNRHSHGLLTPEVYGQQRWTVPRRDCAIVLFWLLLDFLAGTENGRPVDQQIVQNVGGYRRSLPGNHPAKQGSIESLSIHNGIDPGMFLALALSDTFRETSHFSYLSDDTRRALAVVPS